MRARKPKHRNRAQRSKPANHSVADVIRIEKTGEPVIVSRVRTERWIGLRMPQDAA